MSRVRELLVQRSVFEAYDVHAALAKQIQQSKYRNFLVGIKRCLLALGPRAHYFIVAAMPCGGWTPREIRYIHIFF